jgi:hypothetical protein
MDLSGLRPWFNAGPTSHILQVGTSPRSDIQCCHLNYRPKRHGTGGNFIKRIREKLGGICVAANTIKQTLPADRILANRPPATGWQIEIACFVGDF